MTVFGDDEHEPFAYTVGLYSSYKHPELLVYGLPRETAHAVLSIAARAAADGNPLNLSEPTDELLEGYPCVFVQVPRDQYPEHVGCARWYYQGDDFPVQQIVWPSNAGHFPWQAEASPAFRAKQPVLGHQHGFKPSEWGFADPQNTATICCRHVFDGAAILLVTHDEDDGAWQLLCGGSHTGEDAVVACLGCMVKREPKLMELGDLPLGWCADRESVKKPWVREGNS